MGKGQAGQGGTKLAVLDTVGGIKGALPSTRWRGLWPSGVTPTQLATAPLASLPACSGQGGQLDQRPALCCPSSAAVGGQTPGHEHKDHDLQLFPIQPKARAHRRGTQSPEGTQSLV